MMSPSPREQDWQNGRLVSVGIYEDPLRAQMARTLLLSAGIECFLQGEHVNQMLASAFRARLRVMEADAAEAREILREVEGEDASCVEWA